MKKIITKNKNIIFLLISAFIIRLILSGFGTLALDQNTFIAWGERVVDVGFGNFYQTWSDYLPGYIYILWFLAKVQPAVGISTAVLYKLPAIFADLATGSIVYYLIKNKKIALFAASAFLFNPAVIANSTLWGQVDVITSMLALLSIVLVNRWPASAISLAIGFVVKPQAIMAAPVIFILGLKKRWGIRRLLFYGMLFLVVLLLLFLPYTSLPNILDFAAERVNATISQYPYTSVNAFNFWGLFGLWKEDTGGIFSPKNIGTFILVGVGLFSLLNRKIAARRPYHFLAILLLSNFLFFTRMHERHMLPALAPLAVAAATTPVLWAVYAGFSLTYVANMYYSYQWIINDFVEIFPEPVIKLIALVNIVLFATLIKQTIRPTKKFTFKNLFVVFKKIKPDNFNIKDRLTRKQEKALLVTILAFSLVIRLVRLDIPKTDYFDEIYHAFTARQMVEGSAKPWRWDNENPEGYAYEWTHPPLAKEIMAGSMIIFGENSLAWRLPGALAGVVIIFGVYLVAKKLFESRDIAILAAFLISLDGLVLTMSRIGTADIYFVAFGIIALYLFLAKRDFSAALFLGLAAASKWSTLWYLPMFGITFILIRRKFTPSLLWFLIIPPIIYLASYAPMFHFGYGLDTFWGMQKQMWWYHSGLKATHPYTSPWWSWPLLLRPVYLYQDYNNGIISNIYAIGNPFFFWAGLCAVILSLVHFIRKRYLSLAVLIFGYVVLFAPWAASPRIMFIYHYLPSLPLMAILLGYTLKTNRRLMLPVLVLVAVAFVYFFPHWTAIPVTEQFDKTYYWFSSWR